MPEIRRVFMVLSPRLLPYARLALASLLRNAGEPLDLRLITDSAEDKAALIEALPSIPNPAEHVVAVVDKAECDERAAHQYRGRPDLLEFRDGHPCWRKITDPPLFSGDGQEMIILDPDVYFPNQFTFEPTPAHGLLMMWQPACCLYPPETVLDAIDQGTPLVDHVDFGATQIRAPLDAEFVDEFVRQLRRNRPWPYIAHVEAIVWAALASRIGGGHLDPSTWKCYVYTPVRRVLFRMKAPPQRLLRGERMAWLKMFHAGGNAKDFLVEAQEAGLLDGDRTLTEPTPIRPYEPLVRWQFVLEHSAKAALKKVGGAILALRD
ncbi:MAG: hypothetical protein U0800_04800 [Isosphaeraceae bacterium]